MDMHFIPKLKIAPAPPPQPDDATPPSGPTIAIVKRIRPQLGGTGLWTDRLFRAAMLLSAISVIAIVLLIIVELLSQSQLSLRAFGVKFFSSSNWDPVSGEFGALPFIYGTLVSSFLALAMAVPLGLGVAIFVNEMCPRLLRSPLSYMIELLAAIPSVIYGLWGIFVL